jgi:hypothetical protein
MTVSRFPVEAGHLRAFAHAIGDHDPMYSLDPGVAPESEDPVAPPTFVQCFHHFDPDSPLRPHPGRPWLGSGRTATGAPAPSGGALHAEQWFEYRRALRPGDVLRSEVRAGDTWRKRSRRGGLLIFTETVTEYYDQDDHLVVVARKVAVEPRQDVAEESS